MASKKSKKGLKRNRGASGSWGEPQATNGAIIDELAKMDSDDRQEQIEMTAHRRSLQASEDVNKQVVEDNNVSRTEYSPSADRQTTEFKMGSEIVVEAPKILRPMRKKEAKAKRTVASSLDKTVPATVKEEVVKQVIKEDPKKENKEEKGLSHNFKRAIQHLAPRAIGMLIGGLMEGDEGVVAGYEASGTLQKALHDLEKMDKDMERADMNAETQRMFAENQSNRMNQADKSKKILSKTWVDSKGNPVVEENGIPVDAEGNAIPTENLKRYQAPMSAVEAAKIENYKNIENNRQFRQSQANEADAQRALKDLRGTERYKVSEKMLAGVPVVRNLIKDANIKGGQSLSMLGPKVARSIANEVGVLTDTDVTRYVKNPSLAGGLKDSLLKIKSGKMSDVTADNLMRLVEIMEKSANDQIGMAIDRESKLFSRRSGLSYDEARSLIDSNAKVSGQNVNTGSKVKSLFDKYKGK